MYMSGLVLKYDGRKITIQEPTIQMWTEVMKFRELLDEEELNIRMLSLTTGLSVQEIKESDAHSMRIAADTVYKFLNQESKKLFKDIEHNGKKYVLVDIHKMSFGQFVDVDTFLQKDENYRVSNLNELAAYLYTEEGKKYGETDFRKQIEDFKTLPVKYVEGAIFFFVEYRRGLSTTFSSLFQEQTVVDVDDDKSSFAKHWGWYSAISTLADNKVWVVDDVTNLPLISCLNHLAYIMDLNQQAEKQIKEMNK